MGLVADNGIRGPKADGPESTNGRHSGANFTMPKAADRLSGVMRASQQHIYGLMWWKGDWQVSAKLR
jgi:hypothetical protein